MYAFTMVGRGGICVRSKIVYPKLTVTYIFKSSFIYMARKAKSYTFIFWKVFVNDYIPYDNMHPYISLSWFKMTKFWVSSQISRILLNFFTILFEKM
jgi:hypothetical protein